MSHRRSLLFNTNVSVSYLLDNYTANAAYSLRQLKSGVTNVVECRRNDGTILDFTASEITDGTLETWASSTQVTVRTLYDQSGNGNDAVQTTVSLQPEICNSSGVLNTSNGRPCFQTITANANNGWFAITAEDVDDLFFVGKIDGYKTVNYIAYGSNGGVYTGGTLGGYNGTGIITNQNRGLSDESLFQSLHYWRRYSVNDRYFMVKNNGSLSDTGLQDKLVNVTNVFGRNLNSALNFNGKMQELIFFAGPQEYWENIRDEINAYYSIY